MVQKTVVTVVCDLPHDDEAEGSDTLSFALDGTGYEIDVCSLHAKELNEIFASYVDHARRPGGTAGRRRKSRTAPVRERSSDIRQWARDRGDKVSDRGRIPSAIIRDYEASR